MLNPDVERDLAADKSAILDLRIVLDDDTEVDLEMQFDNAPVQRKRVLYYWARLYAAELLRGDEHARLRPVVVIVWMIKPLLETKRFHSIFHVLETHGRERLTDDLAIHVLELSKLGLAVEGAWSDGGAVKVSTVSSIGMVVAGADAPKFLDGQGGEIVLKRRSYSHF